jgi:hypothetical protein
MSATEISASNTNSITSPKTTVVEFTQHTHGRTHTHTHAQTHYSNVHKKT